MSDKIKALIRRDLGEETRELIAKIALTGNLAGLTTAQQWDYYSAYCTHLGLDPITRPFDLLTTTEKDGAKKTTLYANASCATQIADSRGVTYDKPTLEFNEALGVIIVHVRATLPNGRARYGEGVADIRSASGRSLENAIKKASTQAHRRATLALCGVAMPDESEVSDIEGAQVRPALQVAPEPEPEPEPMTSEAMQTAYEKKLAERVEAYEREKAAQPPAPEPEPKGPTVEEMRAEVIEIAAAMKAKFKLSDGQIYAAYARIVGRPVGKVADLKKAEMPAILEMLANWDDELMAAAVEKV